MTSDEVDSFASMFAPGASGLAARREARGARQKKEARTQLTDKQRSRSAVRTAQLNFRCSPEFKAKLDGLKAFLGKSMSIADIMEEALDLIAEKKNYAG